MEPTTSNQSTDTTDFETIGRERLVGEFQKRSEAVAEFRERSEANARLSVDVPAIPEQTYSYPLDGIGISGLFCGSVGVGFTNPKCSLSGSVDGWPMGSYAGGGGTAVLTVPIETLSGKEVALTYSLSSQAIVVNLFDRTNYTPLGTCTSQPDGGEATGSGTGTFSSIPS